MIHSTWVLPCYLDCAALHTNDHLHHVLMKPRPPRRRPLVQWNLMALFEQKRFIKLLKRKLVMYDGNICTGKSPVGIFYDCIHLLDSDHSNTRTIILSAFITSSVHEMPTSHSRLVSHTSQVAPPYWLRSIWSQLCSLRNEASAEVLNKPSQSQMYQKTG